MRLSFVVTSYNILPYIDRCLDSLAAVVRPGDRVILVDDGSDDGTAECVAGRAAAGFGPDVGVLPVLFGTNTIGGVGIGANTGLTEALGDPDCEGIFFVDGDDWLEPSGFLAARAAFVVSGVDVLLGNYDEYDEQAGNRRWPADAGRWRRVPGLGDNVEAARDLALSMIAVPWRKFYRADFLRRHGLRFPEGRFFFEDNPFHWAVCLAARRIAFHDAVLCHHRVNRPGQTMAATGAELLAFFDHYETITTLVPAGDTARAEAAAEWLLNNMAWGVERLSSEVCWTYASRAAGVLARMPEPVWQGAMARTARSNIGAIAVCLRAGDIAGVAGIWLQQARARAQDAELNRLQDELRTLREAHSTIGAAVERIERVLQAQAEIARFAALSALPLPIAPPLPEPEVTLRPV